MDNLDKLSPEDKVLYGIGCIARDVPLPGPIEAFLRDEGLLEVIKNPTEVKDAPSK